MQTSVSPAVLQDLSQLLLELQSACETFSFPQFQHEALGLLQQRLPFDSALWASGVFSARQEPVIFSIHLYNQPTEMLASYERIKDRDLALQKGLSQAGTSTIVSLADIAWEPGSELVKEHVLRYGMYHSLVTITIGPVSELIGSITLYRSDPANSFSETERLFQQNVVPHLVALCNRSRILHLEEALRPGPERRRGASALVDGKGMLYNASPGFINLMLVEWPQWHGPILPPEMSAALTTATKARALFSKVALHANIVNDLYLLRLREIAPCDSLSQREWDVANAFGQGMSYKEIARQLKIAPGTVRNHIYAAYEKLNVSNKAELVHALTSAPR